MKYKFKRIYFVVEDNPKLFITHRYFVYDKQKTILIKGYFKWRRIYYLNKEINNNSNNECYKAIHWVNYDAFKYQYWKAFDVLWITNLFLNNSNKKINKSNKRKSNKKKR